MADLWFALPNFVQDLLVLVALLAPAALTGFLTLRGYAPWGLLAKPELEIYADDVATP